jgi:hypothetical protein
MSCDALCRSHRVIPDGTAFTGVVLSHRGGVHWCLPEYRVQVDTPFRFMGQGEPRTEVRIDITETVRRDGRIRNHYLEIIPPAPSMGGRR